MQICSLVAEAEMRLPAALPRPAAPASNNTAGIHTYIHATRADCAEGVLQPPQILTGLAGMPPGFHPHSTLSTRQKYIYRLYFHARLLLIFISAGCGVASRYRIATPVTVDRYIHFTCVTLNTIEICYKLCRVHTCI